MAVETSGGVGLAAAVAFEPHLVMRPSDAIDASAFDVAIKSITPPPASADVTEHFAEDAHDLSPLSAMALREAARCLSMASATMYACSAMYRPE